ncbi:MAG TPA: PEP-utilizing enzyme [Solidesulfovibrio sp.]|nr:pyruvate, phosphate dikinase [Desulfovibrio sp.]HML60428.1 PEP-utilizing enzyme [Solidesulfovibrio sp.]
MKVQFGTKAETLLSLKKYDLNIPEIYYFDVKRWRDDRGAVTDDIRKAFAQKKKSLVIRSSSRGEDGGDKSMAGAFHSMLNVDPCDSEALRLAIETVIDSYAGDVGDQVLVQPMIDEIEASGVIMTRCHEDGSPYYSINYDDESGRTDSVTGGTGASKTVFIYRDVRDEDFDSPRLRKMVALAKSLEGIFGAVPLDIEFGLDRRGVMHLFQVRRICTASGWSGGVESSISGSIRHVERFVRQYFAPRPGLRGRTTMLGTMPDWNPAEIIGVAPSSLAVSLYRDIITRRVWSLAREDMGYRAMPPEELMVLVAGRPYIDVRNSFNSFLPEGLAPKTGEKLVEAWLDRLSSHPELHDKVEFEVAMTTHDPCFDATFARRYPGLLDDGELADYKSRLLGLTNNCLNLGPDGSLAKALGLIRRLETLQRGRGTTDFASRDVFDILSMVRLLLDECRELGTRPFSIIARHAFIAEAFLRAAITKGAISKERAAFFKRTVKTVSGEMSEDFLAVCQGRMDREVFMERYGRLRPGTYDVLSPRYADRPGLFDNNAIPAGVGGEAWCFELSTTERRLLNELFQASGIDAIDADGLFRYAGKAIAGREYAKFIFTRNLSDAIEGLAAWGALLEFDREQISNMNLAGILDTLNAPIQSDPREHFMRLIEQGRAQHALARSFKLSYLIRSPRDIYIVPQHRSEPNFITDKRLEADVIALGASGSEGGSLRGKIICIENADPGFDWIFTKGIAGLVTKYGGTNSHMAIRCAEYGLPAAIGCGEMLFERVVKSQRCEINAGQKILRPAGRLGNA